jgi:hypothetical protein
MPRRLVLIGLLAFLASAAYSQVISATLSGTVRDPAGSVIPNAQVTLTNQATGVSQKSATNEAGLFVFSSVLRARIRWKSAPAASEPIKSATSRSRPTSAGRWATSRCKSASSPNASR